jgi:hypothetical protein
MSHSLRKDASALLCEAIQGNVYIWAIIACIFILCIYIYIYIYIMYAYIYIYIYAYAYAYCILYYPDAWWSLFFNQLGLKTKTLVMVLINGHDTVTILDQDNLCL